MGTSVNNKSSNKVTGGT